MKKHSLKNPWIFQSTNVGGRLFSNMNYMKNRYRTRLADDGLQSCVKMAVYSPHVRADALN